MSLWLGWLRKHSLCLTLNLLWKRAVKRREWSPTGNDPQIGPQMIPNHKTIPAVERKWSCRKTRKWHGVCSSGAELKYNTVQYSAMQCRAVPCRAVQCSAVPCRAVQCSAVWYNAILYSRDKKLRKQNTSWKGKSWGWPYIKTNWIPPNKKI